uniref:Zgc:110591 n=1 Tax=Oryzias latipes TaxID=8090 RepID=A0A3P9KTH7_ORYLA
MMALSVLLLLELGLYASCFICGIVTAASITIVQGNFGGLCMLYGRVTYNETAKLIGVQASSSASICYFVSAISILVAVLCLSLSLSWAYTLCTERDTRRERLWMNLIIIVSGIFLFFLLITGCMLKIGRDSLCNSIQQTVHNITYCIDAQALKWISPLQGDKFYTNMYKAETAVWVNFFFWLIIVVLVLIQRRQSSGSKLITGGFAGPTEGLFGEPGATPSETEPFFRPQ